MTTAEAPVVDPPVDPLDSAVDDAELTTAGIAEMLPGVLPPLVWEIASHGVEEALRSVFDELSLLRGLPPERRFVRRVRGRAVMDLDLLRLVAAQIPGSSAEQLESAYFGAGPASDAAARRRAGRLASLARDARAASSRRRAIFEAEVVVSAVERIRTCDRPLPPSTVGLLAHRARLLDLAQRAFRVELAAATMAAAAFDRVEQLLRRWLPADEAAAAAQRLTASVVAPTVSPRASRTVFAGPTWLEAGVAPTGAVPAADGGGALGALERKLTADAKWRRTRILSGQVVDVRVHLLRRLVQDAREGLARRERVKVAVLELGGEVRRVHLELGARLVTAGLLRDVTEVDLLTDRELRLGAVDGTELRERARWLAAARAAPPLPERFVGLPVPPAPVTPDLLALRGRGGSPGRVTGEARYVDDPMDDVPPGLVILAPGTDPSWVPLLAAAAAVVVQDGTPMSHAAVLARELGIPAVVGAGPDLVQFDGAIVTVDGDLGEIRRAEEVAA